MGLSSHGELTLPKGSCYRASIAVENHYKEQKTLCLSRGRGEGLRPLTLSRGGGVGGNFSPPSAYSVLHIKYIF